MKCLVQVENKNLLNGYEWIEGEITGYKERLDIREKGISVRTVDGRIFESCHPDCVYVRHQEV